jgi:DNA-binding MarR family transcriptional regulator
MSQPPSRRGGRNDPHLLAWRSLMELHMQLTSLFDTEFQKQCDIDLSTYDTLLHVYEAGTEGIGMTDLSKRLVVSKSGLTTMIDRLEKRGLLRRVPDAADRRAIRVAITDEGYKLFRSAAKVHMASIDSNFSKHITDNEAEMIIDIVDRIRPAD